MRLSFKVRQHFFIVAFHPTGRCNIDRLELTFHLVFIPQSMRNDLKLQWSNDTQNEIVVSLRFEQLRRTFLAQLRKTFLQRL